MLCYSCDKASSCKVFRMLYNMSTDFCINNCGEYNESKFKYKKIAENDDLMHLIYDYFLEQIEGGYSQKEAREVIVRELLNL